MKRIKPGGVERLGKGGRGAVPRHAALAGNELQLSVVT
jgi:hypothetical protein